jgi:mgtE-like transporter
VDGGRSRCLFVATACDGLHALNRARNRFARHLPPPLRWLGLWARALARPPARALRGTGRLVADPVHVVLHYWASEQATMRQGFAANFVSAVTSLVAGVTLASMDGRLEAVAGLFVLIPVSIGMRGNIFGAMAARLGTAIHSGLFEISGNRSGVLGQNVYAAALLTVATSVAMGLLARSVASLFGVATVSLWDLIVVALVGGILSSAFVLAFTVYLSAESYRRGWDLDSVGATLITTVGDVVTLPCLLAASYLVHLRFVTVALGVLAVAAAMASVQRGWTTMWPLARRIFHESLPILCVAIVLDILAGTVAEPRLESFLTYNAFFVLLPGFLARTGALGSILAARLGSKLHLGALTPRARPEAAALLDASLVFVLGISVYALAGVATLVLAEILGYSYPGVVAFLGVTLTGGILATVVASVIGYYAAVVAYRFGFDPDNHTIPVVTSGMDLLGVICLVVALVVFGVGS